MAPPMVFQIFRKTKLLKIFCGLFLCALAFLIYYDWSSKSNARNKSDMHFKNDRKNELDEYRDFEDLPRKTKKKSNSKETKKKKFDGAGVQSLENSKTDRFESDISTENNLEDDSVAYYHFDEQGNRKNIPIKSVQNELLDEKMSTPMIDISILKTSDDKSHGETFGNELNKPGRGGPADETLNLEHRTKFRGSKKFPKSKKTENLDKVNDKNHFISKEISEKPSKNSHLKNEKLLNNRLMNEKKIAHKNNNKIQFGDKVLKLERKGKLVNISSNQKMKYQTVPSVGETVHLFIIFANAQHNFEMQERFKTMVKSLLHYATVPISFHIIGDIKSRKFAEDFIQSNGDFYNTLYSLENHNLESLLSKLRSIYEPLKMFFSSKSNAYYGKDLFYLSLAIHKVMPEELTKVIMLDVDLKFFGDIKEIYNIFYNFSNQNIMGLAHEQQPVYRHIFTTYRQQNPGTMVGEPPPKGLTGFNSGVLLLDLERMRYSKLYNRLLTPEVIRSFVTKYKFQGHLGDQDFYTLTGMEFPELYYILPCQYNRQLCVWWRDKGYADVFEEYYHCPSTDIKVYHGNCHTTIP